MMKISFQKLIFTALLIFSVAEIRAQSYPDKTIVMIIPYAAGGSTGTIGRSLAQSMSKLLKQQVAIENLPGKGGIDGSNRVAKSTKDGYALLLSSSPMAAAPGLFPSLHYKPLEDFEPIGLVGAMPMTLIGRPTLPVSNFKELLAYIRANKDKVSYAAAGLGSASHLCGMVLRNAMGVDFTIDSSPKGVASVMLAIQGGEQDLVCDQAVVTARHIKAGRVKAFGATTRQRIASLPEVPTLDEQGLKGIEQTFWFGMFAPKGTPKEIVSRLTSTLQAALQDPDVKSAFASIDVEPATQALATPDALRMQLKSDIDRFDPLIKRAGQYAD